MRIGRFGFTLSSFKRCQNRLLTSFGLIIFNEDHFQPLLKNEIHTDNSSFAKEPETDLAKHLKTKIRMGGGPISVAHFMREALSNPKFGFYMNRDVFGRYGDFITSPEISQVFGELLGVWSVMIWQQMGQPSRFKLIEFGPGRGTLMSDLLRGTRDFRSFVSAIEGVHLIEISQVLRSQQAKMLQCPSENEIEDSTQLKSHAYDVPIQWHSDIEAIPKTCPEIILGHEFLDALPVHQFIKTEHGWRERMIDIAEDDTPLHFRFVKAPSITPAAAILPIKRLSWMPLSEQHSVTELEIGSDMLALAIRLTERLNHVNGAILFIDYGKNGYYRWSLQGIRNHERVDVLERPGETDVSVHVDFAALRQSVIESQVPAMVYGPTEQRFFLKALGIDTRMEQLIENATDRQYESLKSGYERLIGSKETGQENGMGKLYKAMVITSKNVPIPTGFESLANEPSV